MTNAAEATADVCEGMARLLEGTRRYRVLRRLQSVPPTPDPDGYSGRHGAVVDLETTGLDTLRDEVIEIAAVRFRYDGDDEITGVSGVFQSFRQPSSAIPAEVTALTSITDAMVAGRSVDTDALRDFFAQVDIVISHNARFDRAFGARTWPFFGAMPWACTAAGIPWRDMGFGSAKLGHILVELGLYHDAHRALDDCEAVVELLAGRLPNISRSVLALLLERARKPTARVWAEGSPFALKDRLKARGYRWCDGSGGGVRSWYVDVDADMREEEVRFLRREIYGRDVPIRTRTLTALDRFSSDI